MGMFVSICDDLATIRQYRRTPLYSAISLHLYAECGHIGAY